MYDTKIVINIVENVYDITIVKYFCGLLLFWFTPISIPNEKYYDIHLITIFE